MKLVIKYRIGGLDYKFSIEGDEPKIYEDLDNVLKSLCEKFSGKVEEYSVSRVLEDIPLGKIIMPIVSSAIIHSTDRKISEDEKFDFVIKTFLGIASGLALGHLIDSIATKEEEIIDVKNPCVENKPNIYSAIGEWNS
ncbi:VapB-like antitoxin [Sulfolobus sp. E11-6]|uniref:VapB-like antitoxin n=1 Tax=Sulfolobus sp. E11-6 TaxID=2663020 RepID=UPI00129645AD|nr:VapB-like antitoxin [Sulfolobus sp. E11-6]QGA68543.1 VapB-like antitoxin [Sulfolobus sp. E11-6]